MDDYFDQIRDWRNDCGWEDNIVNTGRNYFTLSLGYGVSIFVDYATIQSIDKNDDATNLANFLQDIFEAIKTLI